MTKKMLAMVAVAVVATGMVYADEPLKVCGAQQENAAVEIKPTVPEGFDWEAAGFTVTPAQVSSAPTCPTVNPCAFLCIFGGSSDVCENRNCSPKDTGLTECTAGGNTYHCRGKRTLHKVECDCICPLDNSTCAPRGTRSLVCL